MISYLTDINIEMARSWCWPKDVLPLAENRRPFSGYSDDAISSYFYFLRAYPEAYGRLGRFVRTCLGVAQPCPARYIFREAHVDVNECDPSIENITLSLGFQPDHFATLNPPDYARCYTARFEIPRHKSFRSVQIGVYLESSLQQIEKQINCASNLFGYSESESYTEKSKRIFPYKPVRLNSLSRFPFADGEFTP